MLNYKFEVTITEGYNEFWSDEVNTSDKPHAVVGQMIGDALQAYGLGYYDGDLSIKHIETMSDDGQLKFDF